MTLKILQITCNYHGATGAELQAAWLPGAEPISTTPGLQWKIWLLSEERSEAGGIYLFDGESSLQDYLTGPIVTSMQHEPSLTNVVVKTFNVMEAPTAITRGPLRASVRP